MARLNRRRWVHNGKERYAWQVRWTDEAGHYRGKQFASHQKALAFLAQFDGGRRADPYEPQPNEVTVRYVAKQYIKWLADRLNNGSITYETYWATERKITLHIIERIGHLTLQAIKLHTLSTWHSRLKADRKLSAQTARDSAQRLKAIFDFAIRREWVDKNPVVGLLYELRGIPASRVRTFTFDEVVVLLRAAASRLPGKHSRTRAMLELFVNIAAFGGLRIGEIAALSLADLDAERRVLFVTKTVTSTRRVKGPKTKAGVRSVPLPGHVIDMLARWMGDGHYVKNKAGFIFAGRNGKPFQPNNITPIWYELLEQAQIAKGEKRLHFHALRHFAASWMIKNGWAITDVSSIIGHSNVSMTLDVYAHSVTDRAEYGPAMQLLADQILMSEPNERHRRKPIALLSAPKELEAAHGNCH